VLTGKYYVDELYDRLLAKPLYWISEHAFLRFGDRTVLDGTLNGLAAFGQRAAGVLSRVQSGSLHLYALFALIGIVSALLWSWAHV
jgi:NADH-quinone oxidoreductase subunit L